MGKLKLKLEAIQVATFEAGSPEPVDSVFATPDCNLTNNVDTCWCSEYVSCECA